jgi:hypothetical protein
MNVCSLSGRLTWRPALRYQANGKPELTFRLTVPNGERDGTQFSLPYEIIVYGNQCEPLAELLNRSTGDWYTHAATMACSSAAIFSTAALTAGA